MNSMGASQRKKGLCLISAAVGFIMTPVLAVAQTTAVTTSDPSAAQAGPAEHFYYGPGMMGYGMWFGGLLWILILIGVIAVIVFLVRSLPSSRPDHAGDEGMTALKLLNERYARSEIDREEYQEKKRDLGG